MFRGASLAILIVIALIATGIGMAAKDSIGNSRNSNIARSTVQTSVNSLRFAWEFESAPSDEDEAPKTLVVLRAYGDSYEIGIHEGDCVELEKSDWEYLDNEVTGAICLWNGAGSEIGVFRESGALVVKVGELNEESEDTPEFRGNFTTILELQ